MDDKAVLRQLLKAGDNLEKARRVDHWFYFEGEIEMLKCKEALENLDFLIEKAKKREAAKPYFVLQVYRIDHVSADAITPVTSILRSLALKFNGEYDGWGTSVEQG